MAGTYLALMMMLLVSRIPPIERVLGQDGLLRWRRRLAPWPIGLPAAHSALITAGYAQAASTGPWHEAGTLILSYPDIFTATVGLALMCLADVISEGAIRWQARREAWRTVHLHPVLRPGDLLRARQSGRLQVQAAADGAACLAFLHQPGRTDPAAPARPGARRDRGSAAVQRS